MCRFIYKCPFSWNTHRVLFSFYQRMYIYIDSYICYKIMSMTQYDGLRSHKGLSSWIEILLADEYHRMNEWWRTWHVIWICECVVSWSPLHNSALSSRLNNSEMRPSAHEIDYALATAGPFIAPGLISLDDKQSWMRLAGKSRLWLERKTRSEEIIAPVTNRKAKASERSYWRMSGCLARREKDARSWARIASKTSLQEVFMTFPTMFEIVGFFCYLILI